LGHQKFSLVSYNSVSVTFIIKQITQISGLSASLNQVTSQNTCRRKSHQV